MANVDNDCQTHGPSVLPILEKVLAITNGSLLLKPIRTLVVTAFTSLYTTCPSLDIYSLLHDLTDLATLTSRSPKSLNGSRLAAVDALGVVASHPDIVRKVGGLIPDAISSLAKSSRSNDETVRLASFDSAAAICDAVAAAAAPDPKGLSSLPNVLRSPFVAAGGLEDSAVSEVMRMIKKGAEDKLPSIRAAVAKLAASFAPLTVTSVTSPTPKRGVTPNSVSSVSHNSVSSVSTLLITDDLLLLSLSNLSDTSPLVGTLSSLTVSLCVHASLAISRQTLAANQVRAAKREVEDEEGDGQGGAKNAKNKKNKSREKRETQGGFKFQRKGESNKLRVCFWGGEGGENALGRNGAAL